jgi:hypothetical protein
MRFSEPPTVDRAGTGRSGDELDTLLRAFFQSEMPHPWPALPVPETEERSGPVVPLTPAASHPWVPIHSRLALAASVGLLLAGSWFLAEQFQPGASEPPSATATWQDNPTADRERLLGPGDFKMKEFLQQEKDKPTEYRFDFVPKKNHPAERR